MGVSAGGRRKIAGGATLAHVIGLGGRTLTYTLPLRGGGLKKAAMTHSYPGYDVLDKWESVSFDDITRGVIRRRLAGPARATLLYRGRVRPARGGGGRGWPRRRSAGPSRPSPAGSTRSCTRAATRAIARSPCPSQKEAWRTGLALLADDEAQAQYGRPFEDQDAATQTAFLKAPAEGRGGQGPVGEARCAELLRRRPAEDRGGCLLRLSPGSERDGLRRPGEPSRLCPHRG